MRLVVLIPAFNDRPELDRTLASLADDPQPFDILVVDDGSDPALEVPAAAGLHRVLTCRRGVNGGIARALNAGLDCILAHGYDVVARLDAGDVNMPTRPHAHRLAMAWSRLRLQAQHFTSRRLDCWFGIGRSLALLAVPVWLRLAMKRIAGTVG